MAQKKKLLFIMESLRIGGAEKSLLTLLSMLDYTQYEVQLFLFRHSGELTEFLPEQVKLLQEDALYRIFDKNWKTAPMQYLMRGDWKRTYHSFCYLLGCVRQRILRQPLYIGWNHVRHLFSETSLQADVAVAYLERKSIYFTAEFTKADCKIGFIHNDYSRYPFDRNMDERFFPAYRAIATVSEHCKEVLEACFPGLEMPPFVVVPNMVSHDLIRTMAEQPLQTKKVPGGTLNLVTVGRLVQQKGYDTALEIAAELRKQNVKFVWYFVGDGPLYGWLSQQIQTLGLQEKVQLVGATNNPYPWMKLADVYVQPSHFEGFGITVAEANVLQKSIVCSDIPEFHEQLDHRPGICFARTVSQYVQGIQSLACDTQTQWPAPSQDITPLQTLEHLWQEVKK